MKVQRLMVETMMTLEEAIKHCNEVAEAIAASGCEECAKEHKQLAEWLTELQRFRLEYKTNTSAGHPN